MSVKDSTRLALAFRSGDRCARPECGKQLCVDAAAASGPALVGEAAHIAGEKPKAARYDPNMTDEERDHYNNLIYLCCNCHTLIDKPGQDREFTVAKLHQMKDGHETKVREALNEAFAEVGFDELAYATEWLARVKPSVAAGDFCVIPPEEKIKKNELSEQSRLTIAMGLGVAKEVRSFVESEAQLDPDFPERLRAGFLEEYYRLRKESTRGDALFDLMCRFAQRGFKEQSRRSAGLAVLIYLFETCEVFEK